jgi:hypothetical protein
MSKSLSKLAAVAGVILLVFVSHSLASKQSVTATNNQLKVDVLTLPKALGNDPAVPRVVRDYSKLTPPADEVMFALVSFSNGSSLVVPQGGQHASEEVGQNETNVFSLHGNVLTVIGTANMNSVVAVYK